ncbi:hypothetical protein FQN53_003727 [Emmonsiellopsis sp. PD_33]|nr:hypothetical protein FQN53_003727 [Emmonsiellopsis sp. PD_33]
MLITPRVYQLSQSPNNCSAAPASYHPSFHTLTGWDVQPAEYKRAAEMLLVHQVGSVRVGEVVRFTLTYTPSADRILPTPTELFVKVRNTSAIPLRAAYLHGPYTLYTACYPSTFDPNQKYDNQETNGLPQFEPNLKAGGAWDATITVPERLAASWVQSPNVAGNSPPTSVTWVIEIASQVIFSTTAAVNFELLVARDQKSLEIGLGNSMGLPPPGLVREHTRRGSKVHHKNSKGLMKGVYSTAVTLVIDDTASLWSTPRFPSRTEKEDLRELEMKQTERTREANAESQGRSSEEGDPKTQKKQKKVHFVILTHGLHSNLGADMLYLKESIDAAAKEARLEARKRRDQAKREQAESAEQGPSERSSMSDTLSNDSSQTGPDEEDDDDEQVIVRGFPGNAVRTERGIQYLGKRLAKYVLLMTYPDQPYLPVKESQRSFTRTFTGAKSPTRPPGHASHSGSTIYRQDQPPKSDYAYKITSISFIGHSLGGLVQTYAIAYIQKHSPEFFERIRPINFVALASPFLGLSNENPIYVRFALDFGLVGRTGQDLGLTWSAPSKVRNGWGAMIGGLGSDSQRGQEQPDPKSKPLLRILPSGPAHQVLKKFRNRTVYSNVVNDGIVPLRTSCLLFLDWRGLDRVEKARRENGLVGTMAEWGWAELTGANSSSMRSSKPVTNNANGEIDEERGRNAKSPSPVSNSGTESSHCDTPVRQPETETSPELPSPSQFLQTPRNTEPASEPKPATPSSPSFQNPLSSILSFFKSQPKPTQPSKGSKIYRRSQTVRGGPAGELVEGPWTDGPSDSPRTRPVRGDSLYQEEGLHAPPKTTFFEAAGDVLKPPLPSTEYIVDPSARPRTIFHDRVYHPVDIPPPPPVRNRTFFGTSSSTSLSTSAHTNKTSTSDTQSGTSAASEPAPGTSSGMKVEEKIARAYHKDLSWRKVLVRLEPDAHNNIIVRRMFANAYGWPVVKHLVDTHFGNTPEAQTADELEGGGERALGIDLPVSESANEVVDPVHHAHRHGIGEEIKDKAKARVPNNGNDNESSEANDELTSPLLTPTLSHTPTPTPTTTTHHTHLTTRPTPVDHTPDIRPSSSVSRISSQSKVSMQDSAQWTDRYFDEGTDSGDDVVQFGGSGLRVHAPESDGPDGEGEDAKGTSEEEIAEFLGAGEAGAAGAK